jgi:exodeoxyribonuclease V alpha subunit
MKQLLGAKTALFPIPVLIYTAVTRGKKLVTIIGQPKALAMAVKNRKSNKRLTKLAARISESG